VATHWEYISPSPRVTRAIGFLLGQHAPPGLVVALMGDLGAGKTCFVQGMARGIGVPSDIPITSPTFSLLNPYEGRVPFHHLDVYRLSELEELEALGFRELFEDRAVTVIEWADRFPSALPPLYLRIQIEHRSPRTRRLVLEAVGEGPVAASIETLIELLQTHDPRRLPDPENAP